MSAKKPSTMSRETEPSSSTDESTRSLLLAAGTKVFARSGYSGATVKEIADEAGVNIALVSYHFHGKEGLFRAIVEPFGNSRLSISQRLLKRPASIEEFRVRLQMFVEELIVSYSEQLDLIQIINREFEIGSPVVRNVFESTFLEVFKRLSQYFSEAREAGFIREKIETQAAATALFGSINFIARVDASNARIFKQSISDTKYRDHIISQFLEIFLDGISNRPTPSGSATSRTK